ncbi:MAG: hypothetical protein IJC93_02675 [Clostridia bacterium]|nr:hypothetical protein [Clostridia bacterium]
MVNLLRSGFFRYMHSTIFKVCSVLTVVIAFLFSYRIYKAAELNEFGFVFGTITFAILITFMIGIETSKCIRNKIPTGYTKTQIYFSELILANIFVILFFIVFLVVAVCLNVRLLSHTPLKLVLQAIFGFFCMALLFANVVASLTCMISAKTASTIACLVMIIVLFLTSTIVAEMLDEPKFHRLGSNESGEWVHWEEKNPNYVDEPWRSVLTFYRDANPYGQRAEYDEILVPFLYSDASWEKAMEETAGTIGNDFLKREISETEQDYLNRIPFTLMAPIPFFVLGGWVVFRKKSFK